MTIDLLKEMPQITGEIGLNAADLPAPSTLCKAFDRISMSVCRVLLRQSAQLHDLSEHAAIDATFYDRSPASRHYCQRISYRVQKLKVTKLVDTASQSVLDVHCSTNREGSDADLAEQIARRNAGDLRSLAADKGYDKQSLREGLRKLPGYVGFYVNSTDTESASVTGAGIRGVVAALGVLATFALLGGATAWVGHETLSDITIFETLVGGLLIIFGLLVAFDRAPSLSVSLPKRRSSVLGFGLFGAGYALAGAGCVAPVFWQL
ncbi:ISH9-type transposase ISHwa3 [Halorubrum saccharovorum DSM 1137]|uniref:ISH9-type transposase ISHwa3 n=1 Tax=Halorubrum saccharovorum DSM 1137 TaxID=1227484 RepID=M0DYB6_9EURY|nr:ISH9-type transposase ISHwa3 [Halorubrum saccharovorum DSM 1137]